MSDYAAFAEALEKRASSSLEDAYVRQKAKGEIEDLKRSKSSMAYPAGVAVGAAGGMALPSVLGMANHYAGTSRTQQATAIVDDRKLQALAKELLPELDDEARTLVTRRLGRDIQEAAGSSEALSLMRHRAVAQRLTDVRQGKDTPAKLIGLLGEVDQRTGFYPTKKPSPEAAAKKLNSRLQDMLNTLGAPVSLTNPDFMFAGHRQQMGMKERKNLLELAEEAVKTQGVDTDVSKVLRKIDVDALKGTVRGALPFALIGALGGAFAVRARRKQMKELEDARR